MLASLNLPAAIEDLSGAKIPASVMEKAVKLREMGGIQHLNKLMTELPELLQRNREILDEVRTSLCWSHLRIIFLTQFHLRTCTIRQF